MYYVASLKTNVDIAVALFWPWHARYPVEKSVFIELFHCAYRFIDSILVVQVDVINLPLIVIIKQIYWHLCQIASDRGFMLIWKIRRNCNAYLLCLFAG